LAISAFYFHIDFRYFTMVQPLELHEMNFLELCEKLRLSEEEFEDWMISLGLIHGSMMCDHCQEPMQDRVRV
jgi:hypothetical protein